MAANSCNFIITYDGLGQVYGASTEATALNTPLPKGTSPEDKHVFFLSYDIDNAEIVVFESDHDEVVEAARDAQRALEIKKAEAAKAKAEREAAEISDDEDSF